MPNSRNTSQQNFTTPHFRRWKALMLSPLLLKLLPPYTPWCFIYWHMVVFSKAAPEITAVTTLWDAQHMEMQVTASLEKDVCLGTADRCKSVIFSNRTSTKPRFCRACAFSTPKIHQNEKAKLSKMPANKLSGKTQVSELRLITCSNP